MRRAHTGNAILLNRLKPRSERKSMSNEGPEGRTYRRCACRGTDGKQLGKACPKLATDSKHGTWYYAIDVPNLQGKRKTQRRGGFPTQKAARSALKAVREKHAVGVKVDDKQSTAIYLALWLKEMDRIRKQTTMKNYRRYVELDIIPALGVIPLERLHHDHISRFVSDLEDDGRGAVTVKRILACLSSALSDAVEQRRLTHNASEHVKVAPISSPKPNPWTAAELATFFQSSATDPLAHLYEVIASCALRRGEALALRWADVDLDGRVIYIRQTLSDVAGHLVFTSTKTEDSTAWVGLSRRAVAALKIQQARQAIERAEWGDDYEDNDLVFARENGQPVRPEKALRRFQSLSKAAGLRQIRVHDLRHGAATLLLGEGVPLPIVSKMLRHSKVGITSDLYGHLVKDVAIQASDTMDAAIEAAAAELRNERAARDAATTSRPPEPIRAHAERVERQAIEPGKAKPPAQTGGSEKPRNGAAKGARTPDLLFTRRLRHCVSECRVVPDSARSCRSTRVFASTECRGVSCRVRLYFGTGAQLETAWPKKSEGKRARPRVPETLSNCPGTTALGRSRAPGNMVSVRWPGRPIHEAAGRERCHIRARPLSRRYLSTTAQPS
ncbi:tyrosine-type recombinase/integrase [Amycolatopsis japonica]|uniref:tyrosine-type recombinase/integrase n=1 Tax=Amycolatopsis japonica TaxID=208439 RepID=UPI00366CD246